VIESLENGKSPDVTALSQPASRPMALGFSDADLAYWRDRFCSRMTEYDMTFISAMEAVKRINLRGSRDPHGLSNKDRAQRDSALNDAQWARARMQACLEFNRIVTKIIEQREIAARPAPAPQGWTMIEDEDIVVVSVPEVAPAPATMTEVPVDPIRVKHHAKKAVKKTAVCRGEIRLSSFADLQEFQMNSEYFAAK
jgi:hypothetical protein